LLKENETNKNEIQSLNEENEKLKNEKEQTKHEFPINLFDFSSGLMKFHDKIQCQMILKSDSCIYA
jgi:hypothetical protein